MEVKNMPVIRPSSDLRNKYNEISTICHKTNAPVYITKNGSGDLAIMSIELYEKLVERFELYSRIEKGFKDIDKGKCKTAKEVFDEIERRL